MLMPKKVKMKNKKKKGEDFHEDGPEKKPDKEDYEGLREESDEGEGFSDFEDEGL